MNVISMLSGGVVGYTVFSRDDLSVNEKIERTLGGCTIVGAILSYGTFCFVRKAHVGWSSRINRGKLFPGFYFHNPFTEHLYMIPKTDLMTTFTVNAHGTTYEVSPFAIEIVDDDKAIFTFHRSSPTWKNVGELSFSTWNPVQRDLQRDVQEKLSAMDISIGSEHVAAEVQKALARRGYRLQSKAIPIAAYSLD